MTTARLALKGDWKNLSSFARTVSRVPLKIQQFSNEHVDNWGTYRAGQIITGALERDISNGDLTVGSCYCDIDKDLTKVDYPKQLHSKECPVYSFYELIDGFSLNYDPITIELTKLDTGRVDLVVSDEYSSLDEQRVLYDDIRDTNDVVQKELTRAHHGFSAQFPKDNYWATNWLVTEGSVYISLKPDMDFDSDDPNSLQISIGGERPSVPWAVRAYTLFTISDIPSRPYTFDLREHIGVDIDDLDISDYPNAVKFNDS